MTIQIKSTLCRMRCLFIVIGITTICCLSCDLPNSPVLTKEEALDSIPKETSGDLDAADLLGRYFEALKVRDHDAIKKMLFYSNKFYLKEPQPIVKWELERIEELSHEEAATYDLKPNPIQDDLILFVKVSTIDEYKKRTWKQQYIVRSQKGRFGFVNRIGADTCSGIYLKYGEDAIDFEEYKVLACRKGQYLVEIRPHQLIVVDEKNKELGKVIANRDCNIQFIRPDSLYCADQLLAIWRPSGLLELSPKAVETEIPDSLKTE